MSLQIRMHTSFQAQSTCGRSSPGKFDGCVGEFCVKTEGQERSLHAVQSAKNASTAGCKDSRSARRWLSVPTKVSGVASGGPSHRRRSPRCAEMQKRIFGGVGQEENQERDEEAGEEDPPF